MKKKSSSKLLNQRLNLAREHTMVIWKKKARHLQKLLLPDFIIIMTMVAKL